MNRWFLPRLSLLFAVAILATGCGDNAVGPDDDDDELIPNLEGFYVYGTSTVAENALDPDARMSRAVLDPSQGGGVENMEGVYGKFMFIGANSTIEFTEVEGEEGVVYGATGGGTTESGENLDNVLINDMVIHGELVAGGPAIEVDEAGLYYVFVNSLEDTFVIMRVEPQMIGDATENNWDAGTPLPEASSSVSGAVFEATDLPLNGHSGYRYQLNDGWHVYATPDVVTMSSLGVPSYGEAWDSGVNDLGFHLENIPHQEDGIYTVRLEFDYATGEWSETKTKTGEMVVDYSDTQMGLFGDAYVVDGTEGAWDVPYGLHTPSGEGNVYTWTWDDAELIQDREFIFLENGEWGGLEINYEGAAVEGGAVEAGDIVDATTLDGEFNNFRVVNGGAYDLTLVINAETGARTVTIEAAE